MASADLSDVFLIGFFRLCNATLTAFVGRLIRKGPLKRVAKSASKSLMQINFWRAKALLKRHNGLREIVAACRQLSGMH